MTEPTHETPTIRAGATAQLTAIGVPQEHQAAKLKSVWWYLPALLFFLVAFVPMAFGLLLLVRRDHVEIVTLVALGVITIVPILAALFCAGQADREATNAWITSILRIRQEVR